VGGGGPAAVDPGQILQHGATRTEIEVTDLAVAHLALRQADRERRGIEPAVGPLLEQGPPAGHLGSGDGVSLGLRSVAETVDDDEHDRAGSFGSRGHRWSPFRKGARNCLLRALGAR
jgi:hypothetical protein